MYGWELTTIRLEHMDMDMRQDFSTRIGLNVEASMNLYLLNFSGKCFDWSSI